MDTAKLFFSGNSQAVRLPKEYRFEGDEIGIKKIGNMVLLFSKDDALADFLNTPAVSDDFFADGRTQGVHEIRESL